MSDPDLWNYPETLRVKGAGVIWWSAEDYAAETSVQKKAAALSRPFDFCQPLGFRPRSIIVPLSPPHPSSASAL